MGDETAAIETWHECASAQAAEDREGLFTRSQQVSHSTRWVPSSESAFIGPMANGSPSNTNGWDGPPSLSSNGCGPLSSPSSEKKPAIGHESAEIEKPPATVGLALLLQPKFL